MALLPRHLLCQRQKPTSIFMKTMTSTSKSADEFSAGCLASLVFLFFSVLRHHPAQVYRLFATSSTRNLLGVSVHCFSTVLARKTTGTLLAKVRTLVPAWEMLCTDTHSLLPRYLKCRVHPAGRTLCPFSELHFPVSNSIKQTSRGRRCCISETCRMKPQRRS